MHRLNLINLPPNERALLASLIQQYATPNIIEMHWNAVLSGVHNDPVGFLSFHRNYIAGLETYLMEQGYPQWVTLPAWNPVEPIPEEFNIPNIGPERLQNLNPNVSFSPEFDQENLVNFATVEELGMALMTRHNLVHARIGGVMNNLRRVPVAPIFWVFHGFIDDIWWDWQRLTVVVPTVIGLSLAGATNILGGFGLRTMETANLYTSPGTKIKQQKPALLTSSPLGTLVELYY